MKFFVIPCKSEAHPNAEHAGEQGEGAEVQTPELEQHQGAKKQQHKLNNEGNGFLPTGIETRELENPAAQKALDHSDELEEQNEERQQNDRIEHGVTPVPQGKDRRSQGFARGTHQSVGGNSGGRKEAGNDNCRSNPDGQPEQSSAPLPAGIGTLLILASEGFLSCLARNIFLAESPDDSLQKVGRHQAEGRGQQHLFSHRWAHAHFCRDRWRPGSPAARSQPVPAYSGLREYHDR